MKNPKRSGKTRKTFFIGMLAVVLSCGAMAGNLSAQTLSVPGGADDPLVSKSYVDEKFDRIMAAINTQGGAPVSPGAPSQAYAPVSAAAGTVILGGEGAEIILRSGSATAYSQTANGVSDVTMGADLADGAPLMPNHLLIIPRADGRGARVTADAWFLIKGEYQVVGGAGR